MPTPFNEKTPVAGRGTQKAVYHIEEEVLIVIDIQLSAPIKILDRKDLCKLFNRKILILSIVFFDT